MLLRFILTSIMGHYVCFFVLYIVHSGLDKLMRKKIVPGYVLASTCVHYALDLAFLYLRQNTLYLLVLKQNLTFDVC